MKQRRVVRSAHRAALAILAVVVCLGLAACRIERIPPTSEPAPTRVVDSSPTAGSASPTVTATATPTPVAESGLGCVPGSDAPDDIRALHMGGNWGITATIDWENESPPSEYLAFLNRVNANWVGISVALHVESSLDSTVERVYEGVDIPTFTDDALIVMIDTLRDHGCNVYLTLAFDFEDDVSGPPVHRWQLGDPKMPIEDSEVLPENWPWALEHPDHERFVAEFWATYTEQAVHFATLADETGVEMFSLGTETDRLFRTRPGGYWPNDFGEELATLVAAIRDVYEGLLTYDMHYAALTMRDFFGPGSDHLWEDLGLDVVGISAYFDLTGSPPAQPVPVATIEQQWERIFAQHLIPLRERNPSLPIVFLEFGYTDAVGSPYLYSSGEFEPYVFDDTDGSGLDDGRETQAGIYASFFDVNERHGRLVAGAFLWGHDWSSDEAWANSFGAMRGFAIRDKQVESIVAGHYGLRVE